ncbi:MAG: hypothetical protein ACXIUW_17850 [Roseinatronobacter sp.]
MKRGPMLYIADVDDVRFKVLRKRDQLPFTAPEGHGYTLDHAFRLRLMLDLIGGEADSLGGLPPSSAAPLVAEAMRRCPTHPLRQITPKDWWAGVAVLEPSFTNEAGEKVTDRWAMLYTGELDHFPEWLDEARTFEADGASGQHAAVRVFLANMTHAAEFVQDRAQEIGIDPFAEGQIEGDA